MPFWKRKAQPPVDPDVATVEAAVQPLWDTYFHEPDRLTPAQSALLHVWVTHGMVDNGGLPHFIETTGDRGSAVIGDRTLFASAPRAGLTMDPVASRVGFRDPDCTGHRGVDSLPRLGMTGVPLVNGFGRSSEVLIRTQAEREVAHDARAGRSADSIRHTRLVGLFVAGPRFTLRQTQYFTDRRPKTVPRRAQSELPGRAPQQQDAQRASGVEALPGTQERGQVPDQSARMVGTLTGCQGVGNPRPRRAGVVHGHSPYSGPVTARRSGAVRRQGHVGAPPPRAPRSQAA